MAERPDLNAIEADMQNPMFYGSPRSMLKLHSLLTYCRELEAENQRLQAFYEAHRYMEEKDLGPKI